MCDKTDGSCLFSHTLSKDKVRRSRAKKFCRRNCLKSVSKNPENWLNELWILLLQMPTCLYFLRGVCTRDVCPYRHVSVGCNAKVCLDFARGYCPNGERVRQSINYRVFPNCNGYLMQCTKRHIVDCPEFSERGSCSRGDKCLLRHRKKAEAPTATGRLQAPPPTETPPTKTPLAFRRLRRRRPDPSSVEPDSGSRQLEGKSDVSKEERSGDETSDDDVTLCQDYRRLSPLDPNCPGIIIHLPPF